MRSVPAAPHTECSNCVPRRRALSVRMTEVPESVSVSNAINKSYAYCLLARSSPRSSFQLSSATCMRVRVRTRSHYVFSQWNLFGAAWTNGMNLNGTHDAVGCWRILSLFLSYCRRQFDDGIVLSWNACTRLQHIPLLPSLYPLIVRKDVACNKIGRKMRIVSSIDNVV